MVQGRILKSNNMKLDAKQDIAGTAKEDIEKQAYEIVGREVTKHADEINAKLEKPTVDDLINGYKKLGKDIEDLLTKFETDFKAKVTNLHIHRTRDNMIKSVEVKVEL